MFTKGAGLGRAEEKYAAEEVMGDIVDQSWRGVIDGVASVASNSASREYEWRARFLLLPPPLTIFLLYRGLGDLVAIGVVVNVYSFAGDGGWKIDVLPARLEDVVMFCVWKSGGTLVCLCLFRSHVGDPFQNLVFTVH